MEEKRKNELKAIAEQIVARKTEHCTVFIGLEELTADAAVLRFGDVDGGIQEWTFEFKDGHPFNSMIQTSHSA